MSGTGFLAEPAVTAEGQRLLDEDVEEVGHVMNVSRLWAYQPDTVTGLFDLMRASISGQDLDVRRRSILVAACASTLGASYCTLAWGSKLAVAADEQTAAGVVRGDDAGLTDAERVLAGWARRLVRDPNGTSAADVQELREAGFDEAEIFGITVFVALRIAFSTVNDALGVSPDAAFRVTAPRALLEAVGFGRRIDADSSGGQHPG